MNWKRLLAYITGSVDQELLLRNEFLVTENRILKNQIKGRLQLEPVPKVAVFRDCAFRVATAGEICAKRGRASR